MTQYDDLAGKRVVICEDEGLTVMQLERGLTRAGLVVVGQCADGQDAVEVVLRERPDIVLMDIEMPVHNGLEAVRQIMAEFRTCVVMLTANADAEYVEKARALGAAGYISKPILSESVLPALQQALRMFYECHPRSSSIRTVTAPSAETPCCRTEGAAPSPPVTSGPACRLVP